MIIFVLNYSLNFVNRDTVQCEFIINSIFTFLDEPMPSSIKKVPVNEYININK